jgi:hypothetical protein
MSKAERKGGDGAELISVGGLVAAMSAEDNETFAVCEVLGMKEFGCIVKDIDGTTPPASMPWSKIMLLEPPVCVRPPGCCGVRCPC